MKCVVPCPGATHHLCVKECMLVRKHTCTRTGTHTHTHMHTHTHTHTHKHTHTHTQTHTHTHNTCSILHSLNNPPPSLFSTKDHIIIPYLQRNPYQKILRRIDCRQAKPSTLYPYWSFFYHVMPAFFADVFLWATGREPRWVQSLQTQQGVWCGALAILYQGVP